jgi:hypothetical protein
LSSHDSSCSTDTRRRAAQPGGFRAAPETGRSAIERSMPASNAAFRLRTQHVGSERSMPAGRRRPFCGVFLQAREDPVVGREGRELVFVQREACAREALWLFAPRGPNS